MSELQAVASEQRCKFLRKLERKRRKRHTEDSHGNAKKAQKVKDRETWRRGKEKKRGWEVEDKAKEKMRRERENICPSVYTSFLPRCKWQRG